MAAIPLFLALCLAGCTDPSQAEDASQVYKTALPSVMTLTVEKGTGTVFGSAFLAIKDGCALTSWRLVAGAMKVSAKFSDGEVFESSGVVDRDESRDLALIRIKTAGRPLLDLSKVDPEIGSRIYVLGAPRGLDFSISDGILSQYRQINGVKHYQHTAAAGPGCSGAPLLSPDGKAVAMATGLTIEGESVSFAVPASYALGLDSTLPTQPWNLVTAASPSSGGTLAKDADAAAKVVDLRVESSKHLASIFDLDAAATTVAYNRLVIPVSVFQGIEGLELVAKEIPRIKFSDPALNEALEKSKGACEKAIEGLKEASAACEIAQAAGWIPRASTAYTRGMTKVLAAPNPWIPVNDKLKALLTPEAASKHHPDVLETIFSSTYPWKTTEACGIYCDVRRLPESVVVLVKKGTPGEKAGLKPGDHIMEANGARVQGWKELEEALKSHAGAQVQLKVRKSTGKEAKSRLDVPKA